MIQYKDFRIILIFCVGFVFSACDSSKKIELMDQKMALKYYKSATKSNNKYSNELLFMLLNDGKQKNKNVFFSSYSLISALSMVCEGAEGKTKNEMINALSLVNDHSRKISFQSLYSLINKKKSAYQLKSVNALWFDNECELESDYLDVIQTSYYGSAEKLDFKNDSENARLYINNWFENETNRKIKNLIPRGGVHPNTKIVIGNAIYFKGKWEDKFEKFLTEEKEFHNSNSSISKIPMMHTCTSMKYSENDFSQVVEIPYENHELSFIVILPKELDHAFTVEEISSVLDGKRKSMLVHMSMPKFKLEEQYDMEEYLQKGGINTAFSDLANFKQMSKTENIKVSRCLHKSFIEVDENGTEAAAATAVIVDLACTMPKEKPKIVEFNMDHPFLFAIRHNKTGTILFMGSIKKL